ncbi:hypothetical protein GGG16DRAFT_55386 [Schizophyllum commune]
MPSARSAKVALVFLLTSLLFWRIRAELNAPGVPKSPSEPDTAQSESQDDALLTWTSEHDGWRSRATLLGPSALPPNLTSASLVFAVTESGMIGDLVLLAVFDTGDLDVSPLHDVGVAEQVLAESSSTQADEAHAAGHIAIDAAGHIWRLDIDDYAAFLDLVHAAKMETKDVTNFYVAHTATCQSTVYFIHPEDAQDTSGDAAQKSASTLRQVGVDAYSRYRRKLTSAPHWDGEESDEGPAAGHPPNVPGGLPRALYELLGLAEEGAKGFWNEHADERVLRSVQHALPRSLLSRLYLRSDYTGV